MFGIVQGGVHEDLRRESARARSRAAGVDGLAIGGTLGRDKPEMHGVLEMTAPLLPPEAPKHLLGIGEPDDLLAGIALGIDVFDCAVPTRLARHGMALAPLPESRFRFDVRQVRVRATDEGPLVEGCPCPTCAVHTRAYLHYLRPRRGADRGPPAHPPQPHLPRAPGRRRPRGDQGGALQRLPRARARRRGAVGLRDTAHARTRKHRRAGHDSSESGGRGAFITGVFSRMKSSIAWIWSSMLSLIV